MLTRMALEINPKNEEWAKLNGVSALRILNFGSYVPYHDK